MRARAESSCRKMPVNRTKMEISWASSSSSSKQDEDGDYLSVSEPWPVRHDVEADSVEGARKRDPTDEEDEHEDVGRGGREVHHLDMTRRWHTATIRWHTTTHDDTWWHTMTHEDMHLVLNVGHMTVSAGTERLHYLPAEMFSFIFQNNVIVTLL